MARAYNMTWDPAASGSRFPLSVSSNGRYFVDRFGAPFLIKGDSANGIVLAATSADVDLYLANRAKRGRNAIQFHGVNVWDPGLSWHYGTQTLTALQTGTEPFATSGDFTSTPNAAYWNWVELIITKAEALGMLCWIDTGYFGFGSNIPWYTTFVSKGATATQAFGAFLGTKFGAHKNVQWMIGGDMTPPDNVLVNALAAGIRSTCSHLISTQYTDIPGTSSWTATGNASLCSGKDFNCLYDWAYTLDVLALSEYAANRGVPLIQSECRYEFNTFQSGSTPKQFRQYFWQNMLSGCAGYYPGNERQTPFESAFNSPHNWVDELESVGSVNCDVGFNLLAKRRWHDLVPDTGAVFLTAGRGTSGTETRKLVSRTADGQFALIWFPDGTDGTFDMSQLGGTVTATWVDPNNGARVGLGTFSNSGSHTFNRSTTENSSVDGSHAWLLMLETQPQ